MDKIFSQMSKIYSDKLSSYEFNEMVNDIKSKYEEEYREQEEILTEHWTLINMILILIFILKSIK